MENKDVVFLVIREYPYQGDQVIGVFNLYEAAVKYAETIRGIVSIQEWNIR